ncbi:MAG: tetratricopeptide repeat protein, partial [Acidiferrobacterales bacterium]|nr:tetratricopeptide repeat protein [Acidiferrobacterales bacterium]
RAIELDESDAEAHFALAIINFYTDQVEAAITACEKALRLNPNLAVAEAWLGACLSWDGKYERALAHAQRAQRLSPFDSFSVGNFARTCAEYGAGNYEQAVVWAKRTIEVTPEFPAAWFYLALSYAHLERVEDARETGGRILQMMPHLTIRLIRAALPSKRSYEIERRIDGFRIAGIPE